MEGDDDDNGPKRRRMRRLGPRWVIFFNNCSFLILMIFYRTIDVLKVRKGIWKVTTTITGPNDASGVVWARRWVFPHQPHHHWNTRRGTQHQQTGVEY